MTILAATIVRQCRVGIFDGYDDVKTTRTDLTAGELAWISAECVRFEYWNPETLALHAG